MERGEISNLIHMADIGNPEVRKDWSGSINKIIAVSLNLQSIRGTDKGNVTEIESRERALSRMGVDASWFTEESLTGQDSWINFVSKAQKMADEDDLVYGRYKFARLYSKIEEGMKTFYRKVNFSEKNNNSNNLEAFRDLKEKTTAFEKQYLIDKATGFN